MDLRKYFLLLLPILAMNACDGNQKQNEEKTATPQTQAEDKMWESVMAIHDKIMPEMSTINRLSRSLKEKLENPNTLEAGLRMEIEQTVRLLNEADEEMWDWMHNLKQLKELRQNKSHKEIMAYLEQQKKEITAVKTKMTSSIEQGEKILKILEG